MAGRGVLLVRSSPSNHMPVRTSPEIGDVIVRQETRDGSVVYIVRTASGIDQYLLRTRDEAVMQALGFAARHGVQAWWLDGGGRCVPLTDVFMVESAGIIGGRRESR